MKFEFNEFGVCLNPDVVKYWRKDRNKSLLIKVAEKEGKFYYGFEYRYGSGGGCSPCSVCRWQSFGSAEEAEQAAVETLLAMASMQDSELRRVLEGWRKPKHKQMTIFDVI